MAEKSGKSTVATVAMEKAKICKSCVKFDAVDPEQGKMVGTAFYLQNDAFTALGKPDMITLTITAG